MNIPKPNPEVYRLAAKRIAERRNVYTCIAIDDACRLLNVCDRSMHKAQYTAMFGSHAFGPGVERPYGGRWYAKFGGWFGGYHPYWNQEPTRKRQKMRVLALLLMADIVENPA